MHIDTTRIPQVVKGEYGYHHEDEPEPPEGDDWSEYVLTAVTQENGDEILAIQDPETGEWLEAFSILRRYGVRITTKAWEEVLTCLRELHNGREGPND